MLSVLVLKGDAFLGLLKNVNSFLRPHIPADVRTHTFCGRKTMKILKTHQKGHYKKLKMYVNLLLPYLVNLEKLVEKEAMEETEEKGAMPEK